MFKRLDLHNEEMEKIDSPVQCSAMLDEIATEILKYASTLNIYQVAINFMYTYSYIMSTTIIYTVKPLYSGHFGTKKINMSLL